MKTSKNSRTTTPSGTQPKPELTVPDTNTASKRTRITYEKWCVKYRPVKNPFNGNASFDGYMFETYGQELWFINDQPPCKIWTLLDCDGKMRICEGKHFVNRIGYFITGVAAPASRWFSIKAD